MQATEFSQNAFFTIQNPYCACCNAAADRSHHTGAVSIVTNSNLIEAWAEHFFKILFRRVF
jgi:hypothetical protein